MTQTKCQQEIEKWAIKSNMDITKSVYSDNVYASEYTHTHYWSWCAAWEAAQEQLIMGSSSRQIFMRGYEKGKNERIKNVDK